MRVLVLALAILLLPLRGWLGDSAAVAMAVGMAQPSAAASTVEHADHVQGAHDQHNAHDARNTAPTAHDCQSTCGNCQLCHSVAIGPPPVVPLLNEAPREAPAFRPAAFASAEPSVDLEPPIS